MILVLCEVLPKTLAVRLPVTWSLTVARPMAAIHWLIRPLNQVAQRLNNAILRRATKQMTPPQKLSEAEYQELIELAYLQGNLARSEKEIILQIVNLDQRTAKDVMKPRAQMACLSDDTPPELMVQAARKFKHRRIPLYDETMDTIVGVLNTRELLLNPGADLEDCIEFPSFVPETMNLLQLFRSLQKQQRGMAIVLDEFGGTAGLVTIEDILEELVGEIRSEGEAEGFVVETLGDGRWRVNGTMRIEDFHRLHPGLGEVPEVDTMGGLLMYLLEVVPRPGDSAVFRGLRLTATSCDERRVKELLAERLKGKGGH